MMPTVGEQPVRLELAREARIDNRLKNMSAPRKIAGAESSIQQRDPVSELDPKRAPYDHLKSDSNPSDSHELAYLRNEPPSKSSFTDSSRCNSQSRCYLCETPKQEYSLLHSFSEIVCRGCLNYEGPDRIEHLIAAARRLKMNARSQVIDERVELWSRRPTTSQPQQLEAHQGSSHHNHHQQQQQSFRTPVSHATETGNLNRSINTSKSIAQSFFGPQPNSPNLIGGPPMCNSPAQNQARTQVAYHPNQPTGTTSAPGQMARSPGNSALGEHQRTQASSQDHLNTSAPTSGYSGHANPVSNRVNLSSNLAAEEQIPVGSLVSNSPLQSPKSAQLNHFPITRNTCPYPGPAAVAAPFVAPIGMAQAPVGQPLAGYNGQPDTGNMMSAAVNLGHLLGGVDLRQYEGQPIPLGCQSALGQPAMSYQAYLDQTFRRALYMDSQMLHLAQLRQQQAAQLAVGQQQVNQDSGPHVGHYADIPSTLEAKTFAPQANPTTPGVALAHRSDSALQAKSGDGSSEAGETEPTNAGGQIPTKSVQQTHQATPVKRHLRLSSLLGASPSSKRPNSAHGPSNNLLPSNKNSTDLIITYEKRHESRSKVARELEPEPKGTNSRPTPASKAPQPELMGGQVRSYPSKSQLSCLICCEQLDNRHFVQCPSVPAHKFCFACTKVSIQQQRLENRENPKTAGEDKIYCPSGKKCTYANDCTSWLFMTNEIETIFRESSRTRDSDSTLHALLKPSRNQQNNKSSDSNSVEHNNQQQQHQQQQQQQQQHQQNKQNKTANQTTSPSSGADEQPASADLNLEFRDSTTMNPQQCRTRG